MHENEKIDCIRKDFDSNTYTFKTKTEEKLKLTLVEHFPHW